MNALVFDSSTIISIATNNLLDILPKLKEKFNGEFYITESVKQEVIDVPIRGKKFKLEALQVLSLLNDGTLKIYKSKDIDKLTDNLLKISNNLFIAGDTPMNIVQRAEIECLALTKYLNASAFAVDERTVRLLVESPEKVSELISKKMHRPIKINPDNIELLKKETKGVSIIRSTELMTIAFELGLLDKYSAKNVKNLFDHEINIKKTVLDATLWGLKTRGCAISQNEIEEIISLERF
jgi:hypothetical protein